jgi:hypothetical protein
LVISTVLARASAASAVSCYIYNHDRRKRKYCTTQSDPYANTPCHPLFKRSGCNVQPVASTPLHHLSVHSPRDKNGHRRPNWHLPYRVLCGIDFLNGSALLFKKFAVNVHIDHHHPVHLGARPFAIPAENVAANHFLVVAKHDDFYAINSRHLIIFIKNLKT